MKPEQFLIEEFANVKRALHETLRYDYGPDPTLEYYDECNARLDEIEKQISRTKPSQIWARLNELAFLSDWISLIERSRLGEFSWPFAELIRSMARPLLAEPHFRGDTIEPIIHVIAEGEGYQIVYEEVPPPSSKHRFAIVAFPRPLKHHVLLHTIFGHELGHSAQHTNAAGALVKSNVRDELAAVGRLASASEITAWLNEPSAPREIKDAVSDYSMRFGAAYEFTEFYVARWLEELICDLFGLLLFGPGFFAAHQALLRPAHRTPYEVELLDPSHPPYAVRHRMLTRAMRLLGWDKPVTNVDDEKFHKAEVEALHYMLDDPYIPWASFFDDDQLERAIDGLQDVLARYGSLAYAHPKSKEMVSMLECLTRRLPPIASSVDANGKPQLEKVNMVPALYAGWVYWLGAKHLVDEDALTFLETNKLCDYALLQTQGIAIIET